MSPPHTHATAAALRRLAAALERENAALAALDLAAIGPLLAEKEAALASLSAAPPPPPALIEAAHAVAALARRNRALLEHAMGVQGRVIALVARAARPAPTGGYQAPGRRAAPDRTPPRTLCARA
ncbi:MAG TPA: hypothetical protein VNE67_15575 [Acetobacteraceae bacterium]|nr:hypothetical protein [Acetobacteraceae bacterium]